MSEIEQYWNTQNTSRHRYDSEQFYDSKAIEQFPFIDEESLEGGGVIDLGCGAGELLKAYFRNNYKVIAGMDFSTSMLYEARKNLSGYDISLFEGDVFKVLPEAKYSAWIATGSLNQYLPPHKLEEFIHMFKKNTNVKQLVFFDCVDFLRYYYLPVNGYRYDSFIRKTGFKEKLKFLKVMSGLLIKLSKFALTGGRSYKELGVAMGYGYLPSFWLELAEKNGIHIEIYSSKLYEYRYHVIFRKNNN